MLRCDPLNSLASSAFRFSMGLAPQIPTLELRQIEHAMHGTGERGVAADQFEHGKPILVTDDSLAVDLHERAGSLPTAIAIKGKRDEKSFPERVIDRTMTTRARRDDLHSIFSARRKIPESPV